MAFSFSKKSIQKSKNSQMMGIQMIQDKNFDTKPSGAPDKIKYIDKLELATINERGMDDLTGASYVTDGSSWTSAIKCEYVAQTAGYTFGTIVGTIGGVYSGGTLATALFAGTKMFVTSATKAIMGDACLNGNDNLGTMVENEFNDFVTSSGEDQDNNSNEDTDNNGSNSDNNNNNDNDNDNDSDDDANSEGDSWWDSVVEWVTGAEDTEAGDDDSNPNPEADGTQGSTSKPTVGPAPGDIGGRYDTAFNPGAERGFTPGNDDGGDGNPGNPWDRNERMSTPNGDGDPVDPLTGFGGPSDPEGNGNGDGDGGSGFGSPGSDDPVGDGGSGFGSSGPGGDLWKPNPDDTWGGGPNSQSFEGNEIEKIFEFAGTQSFDSTSDLQGKDLMIASMSVDTFGL